MLPTTCPGAVCFSVTSEEVLFDQQKMKRQVLGRCVEEGCLCLWQRQGIKGDTKWWTLRHLRCWLVEWGPEQPGLRDGNHGRGLEVGDL